VYNLDGADLRRGLVLARYCHPNALEGTSPILMKLELSVPDEAEMIASILNGDTELYHDLIRPYERSVYSMALSFMKNESDAEDVAQETFLKAFRRLGHFRGQAKFSTWLISITFNEARGRLRRRSVVRMESFDETLEDVGRAPLALLREWREVPSEALERKEVREILQGAIRNLSPIYREVLLLRDVEELSIKETAAALTISTATVKVRLHRAHMMLQKHLVHKLRSSNPKRRWFQ
jgi:RNA polymerase sigma-70 factor (ECF subfamily)